MCRAIHLLIGQCGLVSGKGFLFAMRAEYGISPSEQLHATLSADEPSETYIRLSSHQGLSSPAHLTPLSQHVSALTSKTLSPITYRRTFFVLTSAPSQNPLYLPSSNIASSHPITFRSRPTLQHASRKSSEGYPRRSRRNTGGLRCRVILIHI